MASRIHPLTRLTSQALENLRIQTEATIRASSENSQVNILRLVVRDFKRPNRRSNLWGGPIDLILESSDAVNVTTPLWIKVSNHPHSGFFDELRRLYELSLQRNLAGLIPRPYAYDEDSALLITELVPGLCPLNSFLANAALGNVERIVSLAKDTGHWLANFHSLDWDVDGPTIEEWTAPLIDRMIESRLYSREIVNRLVKSEEFKRSRHIRLPITCLHKDFTLRNVLCTDNGLDVIDWDALGHPGTPDKDPPWNDIGACLVNVESQIRYFPLVRNSSLRLFGQAMLDSYEKSCTHAIGPRRLTSLLVRLRYDMELIGVPPLSRAYTGMRGAAFRRLFRRRLCREIVALASA